MKHLLYNSPVVTQGLIFVITAIMSGWLPVKVKMSCLCSQMIVVGVAVAVILLWCLDSICFYSSLSWACFIGGSCRAGPASRLNITNTFLITTLYNPNYERVICTLSSLLFARNNEASLFSQVESHECGGGERRSRRTPETGHKWPAIAGHGVLPGRRPTQGVVFGQVPWW